MSKKGSSNTLLILFFGCSSLDDGVGRPGCLALFLAQYEDVQKH